MKKTNDMILVFRDERHESLTINQIATASEAMQKLVKEFNALNLGDVQPTELETLVRNPKQLFEKRTEKIEIPKGLSRAKYLQLMELPELAPVLNQRNELLKNPYCMSFELFSLSEGRIEIIQDEAKALIDSQSVYLQKGSPAHEFISQAVEGVRILNYLNENLNYQLLSPRHNSLTQYMSFEEVGSFQYRLVLNRSQILTLKAAMENAARTKSL